MSKNIKENARQVGPGGSIHGLGLIGALIYIFFHGNEFLAGSNWFFNQNESH